MKKKLSIGRDPGNQIVLNDNFVSRKHAELIINENSSVLIKDLGSSNGTFVNGNRIAECYLKPGDIVKCSAVFLNWQKYTVPDSASSVSANTGPGINYNPPPPASPSYVRNEQVKAQPPIQQNIIVMGKAKSVGLAFLLAFFFGPLGLLYASVGGGILMFFISIPFAIITFGMSLIVTNILCVIWAIVAANNANSAMRNQASGLVNNYYQQ